jgi:hypothetical protein
MNPNPDEFKFPNDLPENLQMLVNANWEAAKEMPLSDMSVVVLEGIYNLLTHLGTLVDDEMAEHLLRRLMQLQREKLFTSPE